jgi:trk system potassium uptake protein TrkA
MKIMIVGAGKLGNKLAEALSSGKSGITVVDSRTDVLEKIKDKLDVLVYKANGVQVDALKDLNVQNYDLIIAVTDSDETNMIVSSIAKKLGCGKAIARIRNPEYAQQQEFVKDAMGIDYIVNPELATANEIIRYLLNTYWFYSWDFAEGKILIADFLADNLPGFVGKRIMDIDNINGLLIAAVSRDGEILIPNGSTAILAGDMVYVIGKKDDINQLAKRGMHTPQPVKNVRKVMVMGGGKIGYYLADKLTSIGLDVKILEQNRDRCEYLAEQLGNALVICGDGTDLSLLEEEDVSSMDAFVGATGYDEENLLMTLMAKQLGVKKVIAKVSRSSYVKIIEKLGVDVALNPADITSSNIIKFIRGDSTVSVSMLLGGQAEVTEIIAHPGMPITGKSISQLGLPQGIIIGAVAHRGKAFVPNGDTVIYPGDRFVVVSVASKLPVLEDFFKPGRGGLIR